MAANLQELCDLLEKFKSEIKSDMERIVRDEIGKLNIRGELDEQNAKIAELVKENSELKKKLDNQQQAWEANKRRNNLVFYGIGESQKEDFNAVKTAIIDLCNNVLKIELKEDDLNYIYRLGVVTGRPRPVLVSFVSNIKKACVLNNSNKLKGTRIYISQDMDESRRRRRLLLRRIRDYVKSIGKNCFIRGEGIIMDEKIYSYDELMNMYYWNDLEKRIEVKGELMLTENTGIEEVVESTKKRRREIGKSKTGNIAELFRSRSSSASSAK